MKLLLTSSGITNPSIHGALVALLAKPVADASALVITTGMYPFTGGVTYARPVPYSELGWKSLGTLELSVLPSLDRAAWQPVVAAADAILVWGGDPLFIAHWMNASGLTEALSPRTVYVGTSAGSMVASKTIGETYSHPRHAAGATISSEPIVFPEGDIARTFVLARGMGWVDFAVIPHYGAANHPDASPANARLWASKMPLPTYAIDDHTAIVVTDKAVELVSEGQWELFAR